MKKKLVVLLALIVVLSMVSIPALAGPAVEEPNEWYYLPVGELEIIKVVGGNTFIASHDTGYWTGEIQGVEEDFGVVVIHRNGAWFYKGKVEFSLATVAGQSGTLAMTVHGSKPDAPSDWEGRWVITGGTGGLEDLRGQGTWWGPGWQGDPTVHGVVEYAGDLHFDLD